MCSVNINSQPRCRARLTRMTTLTLQEQRLGPGFHLQVGAQAKLLLTRALSSNKKEISFATMQSAILQQAPTFRTALRSGLHPPRYLRHA
jgi:hypothetical protein